MVDYCVVSDVKPLLRIDAAETSEDAELSECIAGSTDKVKNLLKMAGLPVPAPSEVSEVPSSVRISAKNFAAWKYRRVRDPDAAQVFYYDAQEALNDYIAAESVDEDAPKVGMV